MRNRSRTAAKVTGVVAAAALIFGATSGPAGAAVQDVEYTLSSGNVTLPTSGDPLVISFPASTGLTGTWDDATGDFDAAFTSAPFTSSRDITSPVVGTLTQTVQFSAPDGFSGNIDPATGLGTLDASFDVTITVDSLVIPPSTDPIVIDVICPMPDIPITFDVVATGLGAESVIPTDLALTAQAFTVPVPTCVLGPNGNAALLPSVQQGLIDALALPNANATSVLGMVAGSIPPPPPTTTTTAAPSTTTTTPGSSAPQAVVAQPRFTG